MQYRNPIANLEIRLSEELLASNDANSIAAFDAALTAAIAQTPEGTTQQVAFVLAWIDSVTFVGRVALERDRYTGLRAQLIELSAAGDEYREPRELVKLAHVVRGRAWMADVHKLLAATRARTEALRARTAARSRARSR